MMTIEQKPVQWVDSLLNGKVTAVKTKKTTRTSRSRRRPIRQEKPLNILGCLALVHAVRMAGASGKR